MATIDDVIALLGQLSPIYQTIKGMDDLMKFHTQQVIDDAAQNLHTILNGIDRVIDHVDYGTTKVSNDIKASENNITLNTNLQAERVAQTVGAAQSNIMNQIQATSSVTNAKIDQVQQSISDLSTNLTKAIEGLVNKIIDSMGAVIDKLTAGLESIADKIANAMAKSMEGVTHSIDHLADVTESKLDTLNATLNHQGEWMVQTVKETAADLVSVRKELAKQVHDDMVSQTSTLHSAIDGIAGVIVLGIGAAAIGIDTAIAAGAAAQVAPEVSAAGSLATIAAALTGIVGGFTTIFGLDLAGLVADPEKWLGDLVAQATKMYYDIARKSYEEFDTLTKGS
jgi:phage-related protein